MAIDFAGVAARLLSQSRSLLSEWLPEGKLVGHEYQVGNLHGAPGDSLKINVITGQWKDFATGESGGDLISLYAQMHGISQGDAARKLDGGEWSRPVQQAPAEPKPEEKKHVWIPILPVPPSAPKAKDDYYRNFGDGVWTKLKFVARWAYTDSQGNLLGYAVRFEWIDGDVVHKDIIPQVYAANEDGKKEWRWRSFNVPRPLYNLQELAQRPDAPVLVVEGEKKVEAARTLLPHYVATTWPGGASSWKKADWSPLKGRNVLLFPDADKQRIQNEKQAAAHKLAIGELIPRDSQPGMKAMWELGHQLFKSSPTVKIIIPDDDTLPDGWDIADALRDGWTKERLVTWARARVHQLREANNGSSTQEPANAEQRRAGRRGGRDGGERDQVDDAAPADTTAGAQNVVAGSSGGPGQGAVEGDRPVRREPRDAVGADRGTEVGPRLSRAAATGDEGGDRHHASRAGEVRDRGRLDARLRQGTGAVHPDQNDRVSQAAAPTSQLSRWIAWGLDRSGNGAPLTNLSNAVRVLEADDKLTGLVWYDEFLGRILRKTESGEREWTDTDDLNLTLWMQRDVGISKMGKDTVRDAVQAIAARDTRNCVVDWLRTLVWDGTPRIESFMTSVFGAADTPFVRAVSRNFFIGLVARAFEPGCKQDNIVVLEGAQGLHKSSALMALVGARFYTEQHESATNVKAFAEILQGKWLVEVSEMDAFNRADVNRVKQVASCQSDRYRDSYARYASDHPRQCSMTATVNGDSWNKDETGARRFWPISCSGAANIGYVRTWREQLFAEAVQVYLKVPASASPEARSAAGAAWWLVPEEEARVEQRKRYDADPWITPVSEYLIGKGSATVNEIATACLKIEMKDVDRSRQMRIAGVLRSLGWANGGNKWHHGKVQKVWIAPGDLYGHDDQPREVVKVEKDVPFQ